MKKRKGNLYTEENMEEYDFVGFTANSVIKGNGALVMGAGNAKVVRDTFKGIDLDFGKRIKHLSFFGVKGIKGNKIFALQTKVHYKDKSDITKVTKSIKMLGDIANKYSDKVFACPYPAISNGGLTKETIEPLLMKYLPNNVHIWEL